MFPHVMKIYWICDGLIQDTRTNPPTLCGPIVSAPNGASFAPDSRILIADVEGSRDAKPEEIETHNRKLGEIELNAIKEHGKGVLYLTHDEKGYFVSTWSGAGKTRCHSVRTSWHNMAGKDGRTDVYFVMAGKVWHGVNIGDSQICRCHVLKRQPN